ncbi:DNA primase [Acanthopleuribacter pedis]|uniref:DNA primase n=1 Tax=Acanthopleuribacter pedis TaxID=442870 RepID=A0A8J7Q076_9BACT|nr:DNA primase [Acanthopleuribacter pedis]MBO1316845.1 DNA primase [Acanthopleuribacter pedis]
MADGVTLVKEALALSTVVGRYTKLERRGNRLACCCPIHGEKTPSCYVDDQKGFFHCFGCGRGGDIIKFVMEIENMDFRDALEFLADIAGVELPKRGARGPGRDVIEALRTINMAAKEYFHRLLLQNKSALAYLKDRGLTDNTIRLFKLGYAANSWDGLLHHLQGRFDEKLLRQSGLFKEGRQGKPYDLFRDRIMFPISDAYGNVIAFGGRLMEGDGPKYINSPESPLYTKGRHLYNLDFAKPYLKREETVVVVEGYMDVIQVYQAGIGSVIACLGTAFTPQQAKLLKRYAKRILLNFDGDKAGFKAARASIETFLKEDADIGVVTLPDKLDPDDFIQREGVEAYRGQLDRANDFFNYLLSYLGGEKDVRNDPHAQSHVAREMGGTISLIQDEIVRDNYMSKLSEALGIRKSVLGKVIKAPAPQPKPPPAPKAKAPSPAPSRGTPPQPAGPPPGAAPVTADDPYFHEEFHPVDDFGDAGFEPVYDDFEPDHGPPPDLDVGADFPRENHRGGGNDVPPPRGRPRDGSVRTGPAAGFSETEKQFLYQVMNHDDYTAQLDAETRGVLPGVLATLFHDRPWVLEFLNEDRAADFELQLEVVPESLRGTLREINVIGAYEKLEGSQLATMVMDLLKDMIRKQVAINKQRLRSLPITADTQKRALMRQNAQLMAQLHKVG